MSKALDDLALAPDERAALAELREWLTDRFGDRLVKLVLFGSKVRGDCDEESDLDVLVVVRDLDERSEGGEVSDAAWDIGLMKYGALIQTIRFSTAEYAFRQEKEFPLITNIERDEVPL